MSKDIRDIFENIKIKYGQVASWAVWKSPEKDNLVSNMEVDGIFDIYDNPQILEQLRNNVVMGGYNCSIPTNTFPNFHNFHSYKGADINHTTLRNASKLRYGFDGTSYWGAYMTDIIKNYVEAKSENVELTNLEENFRVFREELQTLKVDGPIIIAFGNKVHSLLKKHLRKNEYSRLVGVTHYAHYGDGCATHEGYKKKILSQLSAP